jgi:hypothetical protein
METDTSPLRKKTVIFYFYSKSGMMERTKVVNLYKCNVKNKCKAIPLRACTSPEGSRRLRLPDFKTVGT